MTFSSKLDNETPQSLWSEQESLGGRLLVTIPFGSSKEDMQGFISVLGDEENTNIPCFPVLTFCIERPVGGAIASTIVFPSTETYLEFIDRIHLDAYSKFGSEHITLN